MAAFVRSSFPAVDDERWAKRQRAAAQEIRAWERTFTEGMVQEYLRSQNSPAQKKLSAVAPLREKSAREANDDTAVSDSNPSGGREETDVREKSPRGVSKQG